MTKRSYQQYCPLAHALDLVGERWTLLIVRELQLGPRRFSDLQRGLPGINPNLLSQRLQALQSSGIIAQHPLPPPARLQAYSLTPSGVALNRALIPLSRWGIQFLRTPMPENEFLGAIPAMAALRFMFRPQLAPQGTLAAEIHLAPDCFRLSRTPTQLQVQQGFLPDAPLALFTEPKPLLALAAGFLTVGDAQQANLLQIARGSADSAEHLFAQFALPATN